LLSARMEFLVSLDRRRHRAALWPPTWCWR